MTTFRNYILVHYGLELPTGEINGSWFSKNDLPMVVECTCCGSTMCSISSWVSPDGYTYCGACIGAEDD